MALLQRHALKDSALGADTPVWREFAAAVCAYIDVEQEALSKKLQANEKGYDRFAEHAKAVEEACAAPRR